MPIFSNGWVVSQEKSERTTPIIRNDILKKSFFVHFRASLSIFARENPTKYLPSNFGFSGNEQFAAVDKTKRLRLVAQKKDSKTV